MNHKTPKQTILLYLLLIMSTALSIMPMLYMLSTALRPNGALYEFPPRFFPSLDSLTLENFKFVLFQSKFYLNFINSVFVSVVSVTIAALVSSALGFILGKFNFKGKKLLFALIIEIGRAHV